MAIAHIVSGALGVLLVAAFAPWSWYPLVVAVPAVLLVLWLRSPPARAFWQGYWFGAGYSGAGAYWVYYSLHDFGQAAAAFAVFAVVVMVAVLALYYALLAWAVARYANRCRWQAALLFYPAAWVVAEWLRSVLFSGFPWNLLGQALVGTPWSGVLPVFGVFGASWLAVFCAGAVVCVLFCSVRVKWAASALLAALLAAGAAAGARDWTTPRPGGAGIALVQGNIPQSLKFDRGYLRRLFRTYRSLSEPVIGREVILWPETALPVYSARAEKMFPGQLRRRLDAAGSELLTGIFHRDSAGGAAYNSLLNLSDGSYYHKRRLVPFGEYLPLRGLLELFRRFVIIPMSDLSAGAGPPLMRVGRHTAGVSICYEVAFGGDIADALPQADYLINVSNDSWFGDSPAPFQLLQMARVRAAENGRYLARVTSTGISAIIDDKGEVVDSIGLFQRGVVDGVVRLRGGMTPYSRWRDRPVLGASLAFLLLSLVPAVRRSAGNDA